MSRKPRAPNPLISDYSDWSADETISAIKNETITVQEYISCVLDRAQRTKSLNAFINLLPDYAMAAADIVDSAIAAGKPPPLAGLAIVAKDNINLAGFPTTAGTAALQHNRPPTTAPTLERLIAAGAIVIGKTNLHELSSGVTSTNLQPFAGTVRNPYDRDRIPGGSSGGTAVAIAARVVTCGLGTDSAGSVRIPASLTGIVGYRPSVGDGGTQRRYQDNMTVVPISPTCDTVGPMGRSVAEVALLDSVITGKPRVNAKKLRGLRLGIPAVLWSDLDHEVDKIASEAIKKLQNAGVVLVRDDIPNLLTLNKNLVEEMCFPEILKAIPAYLTASDVSGVNLKSVVDGIASPDVKAVFDTILSGTSEEAYEKAKRIGRPALQKLYADYFVEKQVDALIFPTTVLPAERIDAFEGSQPAGNLERYIRNTCQGASAGIPGLSLPVGMTSNGLPVGIEIDGPLGSDEHLLAIGLAIEELFGALPPPKLL